MEVAPDPADRRRPPSTSDQVARAFLALADADRLPSGVRVVKKRPLDPRKPTPETGDRPWEGPLAWDAELLAEETPLGPVRLLFLPQGTSRRFTRVVEGLRESGQSGEDRGRALLVVAPFIGSKLLETCRELDVGFFDLCGNCLVRRRTPFVHLQSVDRPNRFALPAPIFTPKAEIVLRQLLHDPRGWWMLRDVHAATGVSHAHISRTLGSLESRGLCEQWPRKGFQLTDPAALLAEWAAVYDAAKRHRVVGLVTSLPDRLFVDELRTTLRERYPAALNPPEGTAPRSASRSRCATARSPTSGSSSVARSPSTTTTRSRSSSTSRPSSWRALRLPGKRTCSSTRRCGPRWRWPSSGPRPRTGPGPAGSSGAWWR